MCNTGLWENNLLLNGVGRMCLCSKYLLLHGFGRKCLIIFMCCAYICANVQSVLLSLIEWKFNSKQGTIILFSGPPGPPPPCLRMDRTLHFCFSFFFPPLSLPPLPLPSPWILSQSLSFLILLFGFVHLLEFLVPFNLFNRFLWPFGGLSDSAPILHYTFRGQVGPVLWEHWTHHICPLEFAPQVAWVQCSLRGCTLLTFTK